MSRIVRYVENVCTATQSQRRAASADPLASVGDPPLFSLVSLQPQVSYVLNAVLLITFLMYYLLWVGIHRTFFRPQGQETAPVRWQ
jgi:hypothetical protein